MRVQTQEELAHGMIFYNYVTIRGGKVSLGAIEGPATEWASPRAVFEAAYAHEQKVTLRINALMDKAIAESDHATSAFLQWFITEQVEEEMNTGGIANQLKVAGDNSNALFMIDRELAVRAFVLPAPLQKA